MNGTQKEAQEREKIIKQVIVWQKPREERPRERSLSQA